jgi:trimethylamine--corrinoid protein Co-methyltransferase
MLLSTALRNGAHFILHACGQVGSFISMSFEKWLIDEETCTLVRKALAPFEISASTIDIDTICDIGISGNYLTHPSTFANFKNLSQPTLFNRSNNQRWIEKGAKDVAHIASSKLTKRLDEFEAPPMDESLKQELKAYVTSRKLGWLKGRSISYKHLKN